MTYTVKYRGADGALKSEVVEAASRGAALSQLKARGITPTSVTEGGKLSSAAPSTVSLSARPAWIKGAIAGLIVVVIAAVALFCLLPSGTPDVHPAPEKKAKRSEKARPESHVVQYSEKKESPVKSEKVAADFQATYPRKPGHLPLPGGNVVTFTPPAPGCTAEVFTVGGLYLCDSEGNFTKYEPPKLFDNRFENTIESLAMNRQMILTKRTKEFSDSEIAMYLARAITINKDDPPDIVERKTATAAMKEEIKEYIKDGGTYQDYIDKLHSQISTERTLHREALREMVQLLSEGDVEGARQYRDHANEVLSKHGLLGLKLPAEWQEQLDAPVSMDAEGNGVESSLTGASK